MVVTQFKKEFEAFSGAAHVEGIAGGFREASVIFCYSFALSFSFNIMLESWGFNEKNHILRKRSGTRGN